jgi:hypothetical protein
MNKNFHILLIPACAAVCHAETDDPVSGDLDSFNTLRDPTFLSSSAGLGTEYFDRDDGAFRSRFVVSGDYAYGSGEQRDWVISAELPFLLDDPGDDAGAREGGIGDFKLGAGHIIDGVGRFRWGLGTAVTFDTASDDRLGDGAIVLSPQWGAGYRFRPDFELTAKMQYNPSIWEDEGRSEVNSLELKLALLKTWPGFWYSLAGYGSLWNFERDEIHSNAFKAELGKAFGTRQEWVAFFSAEVPVENRGANDFALKCGISYVFK